MAGLSGNATRVGWLDGLRGLAAMQVVLMHYVFAFLPAVGSGYPLKISDLGWHGLVSIPFGFLFDGAFAVYLFFIMSGAALTYSFSARPLAIIPAILRRLIRLGLPMGGAVLLAATLFILLPEAHVTAARVTGSPWLEGIGPREISVATIAHQIAFEGLFLGFDASSLLPVWMRPFVSLSQANGAFDTPLWTLHIEFWGSVLVLLLVGVRASASHTAYRVVCLVLACALLLSPLSLFIVGHLAARHLGRSNGQTSYAVLGAFSLGLGILLCGVQTIAPVSMLWRLLPPPSLGLQGDAASLQKMIGAVLVFGGLALLPVLQRQTNRPPFRWLGKISFSLYLTHLPLQATGVAAGLVLLNGLPWDGGDIALTCAAGILLSLAIAVAFEYCIDRPAIAWSRSVRRGPLYPVLVGKTDPIRADSV